MVQQRLSANVNLSIFPIVLQYSHRDASEGGLSGLCKQLKYSHCPFSLQLRPTWNLNHSTMSIVNKSLLYSRGLY